MRDERQAESIAARRWTQQNSAERQHAAEAMALRERMRQALQGPPKPPEPQPPGGYGRTLDGGLRELRQRAYQALRRGEALLTIRLPLP